jgi:predicted nucleic-acid-binding Zn-ribbon protein
MNMKRWKLKGCPRCQGDLYRDKELDGDVTEFCLQCGYKRILIPAESITAKDKKDDRQSRLILT